MSGDLPAYRCHAKLAAIIGVSLDIAGLSPSLDVIGVSSTDDLQLTCIFCGEIVPLPWPGNCCPRCQGSYARPGLGAISIPDDWRCLAWEVSANSKKADLIFDLKPTPTVSLMSNSDVLYPTLDRILFCSGCTASARYLRRGVGFSKLFRLKPEGLSAVRSDLAVIAPGLFEDRFAPPKDSRFLSGDLRRHGSPIGGFEAEVGPAVDPSDGSPLAYLATWTSRKTSAPLRQIEVALERCAVARGAEMVDPLDSEAG